MPRPCSETMDDFPWLLGIKSNLPFHAYGGPHSLATPTSLASSPSTLFTSSSHGDRLSDFQEQYVPSNIKAFTFPYHLSTPPLSPWCLPFGIINSKSYSSFRSQLKAFSGRPSLISKTWFSLSVVHSWSLPPMLPSHGPGQEKKESIGNERKQRTLLGLRVNTNTFSSDITSIKMSEKLFLR